MYSLTRTESRIAPFAVRLRGSRYLIYAEPPNSNHGGSRDKLRAAVAVTR